MRALAVLLVAACCPSTDGATEIDPPAGAAEALELVAELYALERGEHREVVVRWSSTPIAGHLGLGLHCGELWVWTEPGRAIAETAFAHEIAHCYAGDMDESSCGYNDDSHADPVWWASDGLAMQGAELLREAGL